MGLIPEQSFTVRTPAWWDDKAEYVLQDYPGREEAMRLAGHDFDVVELPSFTGLSVEQAAELGLNTLGWKEFGNGFLRRDDGFKSHIRSDTGALLHKSKESYTRIPNTVAYEIAELLFDQGFVYETGGSLDGGKICYLTLLLNEPIIIGGLESTRALPFGALSWAHDGSASLKVRSGSIVQVCENTIAASEAEGEQLGTNFTFRHTKNWKEKVEDAKKVVHGLRANVDVYKAAMEELLQLPVTGMQRDLFVSTIIGDVDGISTNAATSERVKNNIETERTKVLSLFGGPTVPPEVELTGYGLFQAGVEYFDHLRNARSRDSYVKRTLLTDSREKANLTRTIREVVAA